MHAFSSQIHLALGVTLLALASGVLLMLKSHTSEGCCGGKILGKIFGILIVLISLLSIVCLGYQCYKGCMTGQCHTNKMNGMNYMGGMKGMPFNHPPIGQMMAPSEAPVEAAPETPPAGQ